MCGLAHGDRLTGRRAAHSASARQIRTPVGTNSDDVIWAKQRVRRRSLTGDWIPRSNLGFVDVARPVTPVRRLHFPYRMLADESYPARKRGPWAGITRSTGRLSPWTSSASALKIRGP